MKSFKPVLFGFILAVLGYYYFRGGIGILVGIAFFTIGLCAAFLASEDKKMKDKKAALKAGVTPVEAAKEEDKEETVELEEEAEEELAAVTKKEQQKKWKK
jgi:hypothetical protein